MALPHPDVNAVLRFPAKLGTSHKKAPQNLFKTPFAPSNFPPRRHTAAPHVFLRRAGRLCPPKHRTPCPSVGGDAHAVERSGTSTLVVHRPVCRGIKPPLCKGRWQREALTEGLSFRGRTEPSAPTHAYRTHTLSLSCHSEPVLTLAWESASPRPQARPPKKPPGPPATPEVLSSVLI